MLPNPIGPPKELTLLLQFLSALEDSYKIELEKFT